MSTGTCAVDTEMQVKGKKRLATIFEITMTIDA